MGCVDSPASCVPVVDECLSPSFDHLPVSQPQSHQTGEDTNCPELPGDFQENNHHLEAYKLYQFYINNGPMRCNWMQFILFHC
jgi:hypothetical protein